MNIFKHSLFTLCLTIAGMSYATSEVVTLENEQPALMDIHDDLNRSDFSSEQIDLDIVQQEYLDTPMTMLDICRIALTGCAEMYLTLYDGEKDDLIKMAVELVTLRSMVENYCEGCLKDDPIIKKYKEFMHLETMNLHATVGCASDDEITKHEETTPFSMKTFLNTPEIKEFCSVLDAQEKRQYKRIVKGMNTFCHDIVQTIDTIIDHYPTLKEKLKTEFALQGLRLMMTIEFDEPFPSVTYQVF